jgi:nucleotide-binding universal stress UspA family protein
MELKFTRASSSKRNLLPPDNPFRFTRLLVPVDFSAEAKNALRYDGALARKLAASLTLLHVVKPICEIDFGYGAVVRRCQNQAEVKNARARLSALGKRLVGSRLGENVIVHTGISARRSIPN